MHSIVKVTCNTTIQSGFQVLSNLRCLVNGTWYFSFPNIPSCFYPLDSLNNWRGWHYVSYAANSSGVTKEFLRPLHSGTFQ
jgi:hypothetical protein